MKVDIAFPGKRWAVFVDGCFWHGCPEHYVAPVNNAWAWRAKLARNRARDGRNDIELTGLGWSVVRVWTHELGARTGEVADRILGRLAGDVHGGQT